MPFDNFTNPYQNPVNVPAKYRDHAALQKLFRSDGSGGYVRPAEDPVTIWTIIKLHEEYGVPLEAMGLELFADFSEGTHQSGRRYQGRADLVIYDDRYSDAGGNLDVAFIMVEAMEPGKRYQGTEPIGWESHRTQLNAYMSASPSARYAILTSGTHTEIFRRDLEYPRALEPIGDLPRYESAREAAKHSPYIVVLNPDEPDGIQTGLVPLTRDKFREVLGDTRSGCHSILRDNEGFQPQEAVDAMVKFLFAKWYDEQSTIDLAKKTGEARAYVFSVSSETDPERLLVQVQETFEQAKQWERTTLARKFGDDLGVRVAFSEADILRLKPHTTVEIVRRLQPYSLRRSSADIKGGVFEDFLGKTFRDDLGQYFTPTPVINLIVGILQPTINDYVGDPACGSARMLTHVLDYVRKHEYQKATGSNNGLVDVNPEEPTSEFIEFRDNHIFGAETSRNVMHIARINTLMNGAQYADLKIMDSLSPLASLTGGVTEGLPDRPGFYPGGLTLILTNPPFGSKLSNERVMKDFAARDGVTKRNGKVVDSIPQEVIFINRCLEYLAPGGRLGIVLPDGVLANNSQQYIRDWILRWARVKAIISLPQETFAPYGAGVKTSVLFLEKRVTPLAAPLTSPPIKGTRGRPRKPHSTETMAMDLEDNGFSPDKPDSIAKSTSTIDEDYEIFMGRVDNIGYDATGRLNVSEEEAVFPPEIQNITEAFSDILGWKK
jgi:type I restriction enzyme M protein